MKVNSVVHCLKQQSDLGCVYVQAKLVARVLSGRSQLPSRHQMEQDVADFYKLLKDSKVPVRYTHNQVLHQTRSLL